MKLKKLSLVIVITAMAMTFLSADSMADDPWYNCKAIEIHSPEAGDGFETHDRVRVRWTAYYSGDNPYPAYPISYAVSCYTTSQCNCLIYEYVGEYSSSDITTYDPPLYHYPWWIDFTATERHDWLVPGFITAKYPDAYLRVWSQDTPNGGWQVQGVSIRIKMYYDPLPRPRIELSTGDITTENHFRNYLKEPYPNPFNPQTSIYFSLQEAANVSLKIYNVRGQLVKTLHNDKRLPAGEHQENWNGVNNDGTRVPSGIYFLRFTTSNGYSKTRKMVLIQ